MNLKRLPFEIKDKSPKVLDNVKEYSTIADLMKEQGVSADFWNKEYELNLSNHNCLVFED